MLVGFLGLVGAWIYAQAQTNAQVDANKEEAAAIAGEVKEVRTLTEEQLRALAIEQTRISTEQRSIQREIEKQGKVLDKIYEKVK